MAVKRVVSSLQEVAKKENDNTAKLDLPEEEELTSFEEAIKESKIQKVSFVEFAPGSFWQDSFEHPEELTGKVQNMTVNRIAGVVIQNTKGALEVLFAIEMLDEICLSGRSAMANYDSFLQAFLDTVLPGYQAKSLHPRNIFSSEGLLNNNPALSVFLKSLQGDYMMRREEVGDMPFLSSGVFLKSKKEHIQTFSGVLATTKLENIPIQICRANPVITDKVDLGITFNGEGYSSSPYYVRCYRKVKSEEVATFKQNLFEQYPHGIIHKMPLKEAIQKGYVLPTERVIAKGFYESSSRLFYIGTMLKDMKDMIDLDPKEYFTKIAYGKDAIVINVYLREKLMINLSEEELTQYFLLEDKGIFRVTVEQYGSRVEITIPADNLEVEFIGEERLSEVMMEIYDSSDASLWLNSLNRQEFPLVTIKPISVYQI